MRFHVLATDYDGTIARHGVVDGPTREALARVRATGRKVVLVTGRELLDLERVFPEIELFDAIVAENGAVVHHPTKKQNRLLAEPPPEAFAATLRERGVEPLSVGQVIVATWQPHETVVLETIRALGLELQVIFNKGAVMILPSGINKAVGLRAALEDLGLSPHNAVGVGDAENDHAFLAVCECAVAVSNALPALKERADYVTQGDHGDGVAELAAAMVANDLGDIANRLARHEITLGTDESGAALTVGPHEAPILLAGTSGGGKSTLATSLVEQVADRGYQICIIDPEGDFGELENFTTIGDATQAPVMSDLLELLAPANRNLTVNLLGVPLADRPAFYEALLSRLHEMRARTGRPHWLVFDEVHHMAPASRQAGLELPPGLKGSLLVTVSPEQVGPATLKEVCTVVAIGEAPATTLAQFAKATGHATPSIPNTPLERGRAWVWRLGGAAPSQPTLIQGQVPRTERRRHVRKYAAGDLGLDKSFFFRGPDEKLNLRAQNLQVFLQVADGVDDDTWTHHLRRGDYSRWFQEAIKDEELAKETAAIEADETLAASASRIRIRSAVESRYTAPA